MLGELSGVAKVYIICGRTDMRRSIDGLMAIIRDTYEMDPYANALYLFCGRKKNTLKALHFDKDGFVLYIKRLVMVAISGLKMPQRYALSQDKNFVGLWKDLRSNNLKL